MPGNSQNVAVVKAGGKHSIFVETDLSIELPAEAKPIRVEVAGVIEGEEPVGLVEDLKDRLQDVKELIATCCDTVHASIAEFPKPKKIGVEIGIKFAGEFGIPILTKASGEASLVVTVEWEP